MQRSSKYFALVSPLVTYDLPPACCWNTGSFFVCFLDEKLEFVTKILLIPHPCKVFLHAPTKTNGDQRFLYFAANISPNDGERIFHGVSPPRRWSHRMSWDGFRLRASVCGAADSLSPRPDGSCTQICIHFPLISSEIAGQLHLLSNTV